MIVRQLDEIVGSEDDVHAETWNSRRFLRARDGMGFSMSDTIIHAGTETFIWYANHLEAVYWVEGEGEIELIDSGEVFPLRPGTFYALNGNEKHFLRAHKTLRGICVFNPPLTGREVHDENGVYPLVVE